MSEPIFLRPAIPADCNALTTLALVSKAHWGYDAAFMRACEASLTITPEFIIQHHVVVAQRQVPTSRNDMPEGNTITHDFKALAIVGFYALSREQPEAEVEQCFVAPDAIGLGIGKRLWQDLESAAVTQGATALTVLSDPNAAGFYRRMGMTDVGSAPSDVFGSERPLPVLKKTLNVGSSDPGSGASQ